MSTREHHGEEWRRNSCTVNWLVEVEGIGKGGLLSNWHQEVGKHGVGKERKTLLSE